MNRPLFSLSSIGYKTLSWDTPGLCHGSFPDSLCPSKASPSTFDSSTHFQTFWIGLWPTGVISLLLTLSHLTDSHMFLVYFYCLTLLDTLNPPCLHFELQPLSLTSALHTWLLDSISGSCIVADTVGTPQLDLWGLPLCQCQCVTSVQLTPVLETLCIVVYEWPHLSVTLTEDQALHRQPHTHRNLKNMSDRLLNKYWESLSWNRLFLQSLFEGQHKQLQQLKESNAFFQTQVTDTHDDITNVSSATVSAVAQAITMNPQASIPIQTSWNPTWSAKAADPLHLGYRNWLSNPSPLAPRLPKV